MPFAANLLGYMLLSVLVFSDLQCPDCAAFQRTLDEILVPRFDGRVSFEHRDFPLPKHTWARRAAVAAQAFEAQRAGLGSEFRRWILERVLEIDAEGLPGYVAQFAGEYDADSTRTAGAEFEAAVEASYRDGVARGVARTPTVIVGEVPFVEHFSVEALSAAIEAALGEVRA